MYIPYSIIGIRVESGSDDPDNPDHFLDGSSGFIYKLNYLDVTWIFNRLSVCSPECAMSFDK